MERTETRPPAPIVVFLGPSLPVERARGILDAEYRPEARKGDIYRLLTTGATAIVLIDGIFHSGPSIWQREILAALDEGIAVLGASSMGALRAAELHPFGMVGHGTVFEWYRDGLITGDDEVALRHAPGDHGYRALSTPLVDIRYTLGRAAADGLLSPDEAEELVSVMKEIYYPDRSYRALLASPALAAWPAARRAKLDEYLRTRAVSIKAEDAASVLAYCARAHGPAARRPGAPVDLWSEEFRYASLRFRMLEGGAPGEVAWPELARAARQLATWPETRRGALVRWFLSDWARLRGIDCPVTFARSFEARWRSAHQVEDVGAWSRARGLTSAERSALLAQRALEAWLLESGPARFGLEWDTDAEARFDALLDAADAPRLPVGAAAFIAAWARESGVRCPRAARDQYWTRWALGSEPARRRAARSLGTTLARLRRLLDEHAVAEWVAEQGPESFGRMNDLDLTAVLELQLSTPLTEILSGGDPS